MSLAITKDNFESEVLKSDIPVLIDFWSAHCMPCMMVAPVIDDLSREFDGKMKVGKINVDEQPELAIKYNIMSIPTMAVFKDGKIASMTIGAMGKEELKKQLQLSEKIG